MASNKVIGGTETLAGRFPYAVFVEHGNFDFCSGTLIAPRIVLTSAQCALESETSLSSTKIYIDCFEAGNNDLRDNCEEFFLTDVIIHPDFEPSDNNYYVKDIIDNDIGLLVLNRDSNVQPVTLIEETEDLINGVGITVVGWGASEFNGLDDLSDNLLETQLTLVDESTCSAQIESALLAFVELDDNNPVVLGERFFCAVGNSNGVCSSSVDEGTGFFLNCDDNPTDDLLIGVLGSTSKGCGSNGVPIVIQSLDLDFILGEATRLGQTVTVKSFVEGQTCSGSITASPVPPTPFPTFLEDGWTCPFQFFNALDGCDCNCGIPDPDCDVQSGKFNIFNCPGEDFICINAECIEWTCDSTEFNDGEFCNCGCGSPDPDCDIFPRLPVVGCSEDELCGNNGCKAAPQEWTCDVDLFDNDDGCHCNCGVQDPDCVSDQSNLIGCDNDNICVNSQCIEWTCNLNEFNDGEICNCGCSSVDPDCVLEQQLPVVGCDESLICVEDNCVVAQELITASPTPVIGSTSVFLIVCIVFVLFLLPMTTLLIRKTQNTLDEERLNLQLSNIKPNV